MLSSFDWIRRSRTGAELLATLKHLAAEPDRLSRERKIGPPHSALNSPCQRCWIYPCMPRSDQEDDVYCEFCKAILDGTRGLGNISRQSVVIWGFVNRLPKQFQNGAGGRGEEGAKGKGSKPFLGAYVHDENRFLLMMYRRELKPWLQELVLYNGADLRGLVQILPTIGSGRGTSMGEILCRTIHHEANFPMDQLRVRFYSDPSQVLKPHIRDRQGLLTFEVSEFLNLLEMTKVFRVLLRPEEQKMLYELLTIGKNLEEQFHWGRFQGHLSQEAKDMLNAWNIRHWPKDRIKLLYELTDYVYVPSPQFH
jgi:hypothetical protein